MPPREWRTARLLIRRLREDDLPGLYELHGDAEAMKFLGGIWTLDRTREVLHAIIANYETRGLEWRAVTDRRNRAFLGVCWLGQLSSKACQALGSGPHVELGYRYLRGHWGQGYATEAGAAMLHRGFAELELDEIVAIVDPHNVASDRVINKLGMTYRRTFLLCGRPIKFYTLKAGRAGSQPAAADP